MCAVGCNEAKWLYTFLTVPINEQCSALRMMDGNKITIRCTLNLFQNVVCLAIKIIFSKMKIYIFHPFEFGYFSIFLFRALLLKEIKRVQKWPRPSNTLNAFPFFLTN